jgi:hypothetical protein
MGYSEGGILGMMILDMMALDVMALMESLECGDI